MNRDDIIRLARERHVNCEYTEFGWQEVNRYEFSLDELIDFAAFVAAHERDACAKVADEIDDMSGREIAANIRARGEV